ncbi:MAG: Gfo/Idh/MocA family protein, partial [Caulobacteraceae bacterium]
EFLDAAKDVVTIASPAVYHAQAVEQALAAGRHVYVEKPLAVTVEDARRLAGEARGAGLVLAVGHQERAVFGEMGLLGLPQRPLRFEAVRRGTPSDRNLDVSCVLDLMIHDIDLALTLNPSAVRDVAAHGDADEVDAEITFDDGAVATFSASRVAAARERTMLAAFPSGEVRLDFLTRAFVNGTPYNLLPDFAETPRGKDPLGASVMDFLAAVRGEAPRPLVTGDEAARALDIALRIERAAGISQEN